MARKNLSKLMESELDKAEAVLAVKGLSSEIQSMTEKVAKMRVDDLLPLVERVKEVFGIQEGETLQQNVDSALETLQNNLTEAKDTVENSALVLNGEAPAGETDMGMPGDEFGTDMGTDMDLDSEVPMDGEMGDELQDDPFGAADENVADDEPLGRVKKESVKRKGKKLSEAKRKHLMKKLRVLEGKIKKARKVKAR